jgi:hypothetical protein
VPALLVIEETLNVVLVVALEALFASVAGRYPEVFSRSIPKDLFVVVTVVMVF